MNEESPKLPRGGMWRKTDITRERVLELLDYDAGTGLFTWKQNRRSFNGKAKKGAVAGLESPLEYTLIGIDGKRWAAHRLAWLVTYGCLPSGDLDHINMVKTDNRITNLRIASRSENERNRQAPKTNKSGFKGVGPQKGTRKFRAKITIHGKQIHLGYFHTIQDAAEARREAAIQYHGEFARS